MITMAILIGTLLGVLEWALLASSRQKLGFWVYAQSIMFWFTCGVMIGIVDSPLAPYISGAMVAVFLNLPWYINVSIIPKQYKHLAPLMVASIVLGMLGGVAKILLVTML